MEPFYCHDIKEMLKQKDSLLKHIKEVEEQRKEEIDKFNSIVSELEEKNRQNLAIVQRSMESAGRLQQQITDQMRMNRRRNSRCII